MDTETAYLIIDLIGLCAIAWMLYFTEGETWLTREYISDLSFARNAITKSAGSIPGSPRSAQNADDTSTPTSDLPS
jgi:hypothetical protein